MLLLIKATDCCEISNHLEVWLLQDADQLFGHLAPVCERIQLLENVLDQLHVVLPHSLKLGFLEPLMSLEFREYITIVFKGYLSNPYMPVSHFTVPVF